jgi:hypothetical protein
MENFNKEYLNIVTESRVILNNIKPVSKNIPTLDEIKTELLKLFKFSDWNEFIDMQQTGQCSTIAKAVCRLFPKVKMVSAIVTFSDLAKLEINDDDEMNCVHYFNQIGKEYFDFAKGTNRYKNVYVMKGDGDIYDVTYTEKELKLISEIRKEDPKAIGTILR